MLKYIALLFNTVALLIYQFFFAEGITVTQKIPASVKPETEFIVELTINKGSTSGFAKLQQDLPEGFTAVQDDNNGASFTFSNQSVKLIWMSLPADQEFKVKYKVKVAAGVSGAKTIGGKFSYVADNVKQSIDISPATVNVEGAASQPIVTNTPPENKTPENTSTASSTENTANPTNATTTATNETASTTTTPVATTTETATTTSTTTTPTVTDGASNNTQEPSSIKCTRKINNTSASEAIVEVFINKGNASGFAKLIETIPAGCTATLNEAQGSSFTFADGKAKFVWVSMPSQPEYKISYKLAITNPAPGQAIDGVFSYIENDETKKFVLASMPLNSSSTSEPVVSNTTTNTTNTNTTTSNNATTTTTPENKTAEPVNTTSTTNNDATNTASNTASNTTTNNGNETKALSATTIPTPQTAVNYKVQIAALQKAVSADALATRYGINEKIITEMADGFTKYTIGAHNEYKSARDAREVIKNKGVAGPFVTAYNSGKRITVQEALMITSQKWYR